MSQHLVELLAPAGNMVCLHAAVRAGADAVYVGAAEYNARRGADNFTLETLKAACDFAHLRGVRLYLTVNTVVLPSEVSGALELVRQAWVAGVDAFIVQDIGLLSEIVRTLPEAEIHVSTQMNIHNEAGVLAAAALGAKRVTFARELSLAEVNHLTGVAHAQGMASEVFAHGALCVCYSGQCFASSLVGGRSANRGMCAQVCRLPYALHNVAVNKPLPAEGEHLLSPKDLSTIDLLEDLVATGLDSLKIEGRMKSPEYVYAVVSTYRSVLNRVLGAEAAPHATKSEHLQLEEAFSRGFTQAYLVGESGNSIMSYGRPNNRGVFVGRVTHVANGLVDVACEMPLVQGDVVEFWTNKGHFAHTITQLQHSDAANTVAFAVDKPVGKGDRVFRVRSAAAAFEDNNFDPRVLVDGSVDIRVGQRLRLELTNAAPPNKQASRVPASHTIDSATAALEYVSASAEGAVVEAARTKAISEEDVREHIDRFGNTPFALRNLSVGLDSGAGLGFSALHHVRADAADKLQDAMLAPWTSRKLPRIAKRERAGFAAPHKQQTCMVAAWATNAACARAARKAGVDALYVPALNYKRGEAIVAGQKNKTVDTAGYPKQAIIALPAIDRSIPAVGHTTSSATDCATVSFSDQSTISTSDRSPAPTSGRSTNTAFDPWIYAKPGKPVFADSLGSIFRALEEGMQVEAGPHVPVTNAFAANTLAALGVQRIWLSPELTLGQIQDIANETDVPLGLFVSGAAELMITEHCLLASQGPCNEDCASCVRGLSPHYLKDRKGYTMPVITDCCGRSHLYNAVPLDVLHLAPDLIAAGVSAFMVDTTLLNTAEAAEACTRAIRARDLAQRTGDALGKKEQTTTGHMFRSVS